MTNTDTPTPQHPNINKEPIMSHTTTQTLCKYLQPNESVDEYIVISGVEMAAPSPYMQTARGVCVFVCVCVCVCVFVCVCSCVCADTEQYLAICLEFFLLSPAICNPLTQSLGTCPRLPYMGTHIHTHTHTQTHTHTT